MKPSVIGDLPLLHYTLKRGKENKECVSEWSKSERERQVLYINMCIWKLERWYWWPYLQESTGDADMENGLVGLMREGEIGRNWENSTETCTLSHVKWIASRNLLCDKGSSTHCSVTTKSDEMGWEMGVGLRREGTCVYLWQIHADVWQRPTQYCKSIILWLKKKDKCVKENFKKIIEV